MNRYYLRGPIVPDVQFFFVCDQIVNGKSILYFLSLNESNQLIFDPEVRDLSRIPTFTTNDGTTIKQFGSNNGLTHKDGLICLGETSPIQFTTTQVNPWNLLLTGVNYTAKDSSDNTLAWRTTQTTVTLVRVVPIQYYMIGNCSQGSNSLLIASNNERAWFSGTSVSNMMTRATDCQAGYSYDYCVGDQGCSTTCAGPCPQGICGYNSNLSLSCIVDSQTSRTWLWIIIVIAVILIILIVIVVLVLLRK
jgi:hypothetical protein